jgi:starch phosphorylase
VLVIQTTEPRAFETHEVETLSSAARQIGPIVAKCRTLEKFVAPVRERLWTLARNLWWSWDEDVVSLFRDLDPVRWRELYHNPVPLVSEISLADVERRAGQRVLHSRVNYAYRRLQAYLKSEMTWGATHAGVLGARPVAYFSAEFGLHESLPIYSGGLGVLSGDHIKSASDLGIPLVGIGLFYDQGYFHQRLDEHGWQREEYIDTDVAALPLELALGEDGQPVNVCVRTRSSRILARVWRAAVGRTTLLLLDSDVDGNQPEDRQLTSRLYGGDQRIRIHQELLLGVGGVQALYALGITPGVYHLNEGHSAFATLEGARRRMEADGLSFHEAANEIARQTVFTTHTPVPAGHDRFSPQLIEEHLGPLRELLGLSNHELLALGRVNPHDQGEPFCMTVLALKLSRRANGVSALHGEVSRRMWQCLWPQRSEREVPIGHITNGIHVPTWLAGQMQELYDRHLGPAWRQRSGEPDVWMGIDRIDDGELWETHLTLKGRLIDFARRRIARQVQRRGETNGRDPDALLSPDALTIGFARRFATYKRANLMLRDLQRFAALITNPKLPVQFVFAGKAHPHDEPGKRVLQEVAQLMKDDLFAGRIVFIEDYDINVGRHLVQGVDVWLNNPRRPLEASGTSGEKVVLNGGLNLSVLDGWWAEAYDGLNGFAIGTGVTHRTDDVQDQRDNESLMRVLREQVIPLYYERDHDGLPHGWIGRMKRSIRTLGWRFNADRMVMDYVRQCYVPAAGGTSCENRSG